MSQTEVQLIKSSSVVDGDIVGMSSSKLTGTLPAVSAANLTNLPAANLTGTLPAISGANLTGISAGITEYDEWRITSDFSASTVTLTSNWERVDNDGNSVKIGTGWTESSGIFTPASNGIYRIHFQTLGTRDEATWAGANINYSIDSGSNYATLVFGRDANSGNSSSWCQAIAIASLDVTNYANTRVSFSVDNYGTWNMKGNTGYNTTWCSFTRLGDT